MKKLTIKRLEVGSIAKFVGTINLIVGFVIGLFGSFGAIVSVVAANDYTPWQVFGISLGSLAAGLILYPLVMFLFGWLYGAVVSLVFNLFVGVSGGITVDVDESK